MYAQETFHHPAVQANAHRVIRNGEPLFEVTAISFVQATLQQAWRVLTEYERLPDFVPDLASSKLVSRNGQEAVIEQSSNAGFLFMAQPIHMLMRITEQPFSTIDAALIEGNMKRFSTHWDLDPAMQDGMEGTRVTFSGSLVPEFFVPPLFGRAILQANVKKTVEAVVTEIKRYSTH